MAFEMRSCLPVALLFWMVLLMMNPGGCPRAHEAGPYFLGNRLLINGTINQRPVCFAYDTGASVSVLFAEAAKRLDLKIESKSEMRIGGQMAGMGLSEPVEFGMFGVVVETPARVLMVEGPDGIDGILGWRSVAAPIVLIDGYDRKIRTLRELPTTGWKRWKLDRKSPQLFFEITREGKPLGRVFVDTGSAAGLRLAPRLWEAWRAEHPEAGVTLERFRYVVGEEMVHPMSWTREYHLGNLVLYNIDIGPIPEARDGSAVDARGKEFIATIGTGALRHLRLIISRVSDEVLAQAVSPIPDHNRLGAVFIHSEDGASRVANVLEGSPAWQAGLRDGDVLIEINGVDFTVSGARSTPRPAEFFSRPAGTEVEISIQRDGETEDFRIRLKDLLN